MDFKCFSLLSKAKDRLRSLSIAELKLVPRGGNPSEHIEILAQLENLRHLFCFTQITSTIVSILKPFKPKFVLRVDNVVEEPTLLFK